MLFDKKIVEIYRSIMFSRCDDKGTAFYFSAEDFEGLKKEPYSFASSLGHALKGYIYCYDKPAADRIVIFEHGIGGGHRSYMKEIEMLCRHGFSVLAYDHTGCMESGGDNAGGMAQSLRDLNDCIVSIKENPRFADIDISVIGHSWGGFSALNIAALQPEVSHIVAMSGFVSVQECVNSFFPGILKPYRKPVMEIERRANPAYVDYNAVSSLSHSGARALLIYSDNDKMCRKINYDILFSALGDKENIRFLLVSGKGHNPNYTADAVKYLGEYVRASKKLTGRKKPATAAEKAAFVASFDWNRITAQDEAVWNEIFACLAQ